MPLYALKCWKRDVHEIHGAWELESEWTIEANGDDDARSQAIGFVGLGAPSRYASLVREGGKEVWQSDRMDHLAG